MIKSILKFLTFDRVITLLLVVAVLSLVGAALADEAPASTPIDGQPATRTESLAAISALREAAGYSANVEYAGAIYSCAKGYYHYTHPVRGSETSFEIRIFIPKGCALLALYHTHPAGSSPNRFSARDVSEARRLNVHSYVGDLGAGTVITLDRGPSDSAQNGVPGRVIGSL